MGTVVATRTKGTSTVGGNTTDARSSEGDLVLALVPHFGRFADTLGAVESLLASDHSQLRVLVLDNDGACRGKSFGDPRVEIRGDGHNEGYCRAINRGLEHAREIGAPFVLQVNSDARVAEDCISSLLAMLQSDRTIAGAMPLLTMGHGARIWAAGSILRFGPNEVAHRSHGAVREAAPRFPESVDFLPGAVALYRSEELFACGGLDERYFMYGEDVELGLRLRRLGRRLIYVPWATAEHEGTVASGGGVSPLRKFLMGVNTPRFLRAARSPRLWLSFLLFDLLGAFPAICVSLLDPGGRRAQVAKLRGSLKGVFGYEASEKDVRHYLGEREAEELGEGGGSSAPVAHGEDS